MMIDDKNFFVQIELIINTKLFKKSVISEEIYLKAQEKLINKLK